jgi:hypothetical protein
MTKRLIEVKLGVTGNECWTVNGERLIDDSGKIPEHEESFAFQLGNMVGDALVRLICFWPVQDFREAQHGFEDAMRTVMPLNKKKEP